MKLFLDESGNDGHSRAFLVGGWMFRDDRTAAFEASWHEALAREPAIGYCKHSDAKGRSGPFERWLPEDIEAKLFQLADVICRHASGAVVSIFPHKLFEYLISELTIPKKKRQSVIPDIDPYALSVHNVIASALQVHGERGGDDLIDFVFDSGQEALILGFKLHDRLERTPWFL